MFWTYTFTAKASLNLAAAVWMGALGYFGWRRGDPAKRSFAWLMAVWAVWAFGVALETAAVDVQAKFFWRQYQYFWGGPLTVASLYFVLEYARLDRWLTRPVRALLLGYMLLGTLLVATNSLHGWVWSGFDYDGIVLAHRNWGYWLIANTGYPLTTLVNLPVLVWLLFRSPLHRWPVALVLLGQTAVRVGLGLDYTSGLHGFETDYTVLAASFNALTLSIALFGLGMLAPLPLAHRVVMALMHDGVLVLDPAQKIISLNPAAERILKRSAAGLHLRPASEALPCFEDLAAQLQDGDTASAEINLETGGGVRHFTLDYSSLRSGNELIGYLLLLHDISEQKRAQAQVLEQQRALAMLAERERLARELHDSIGQVLGFAGLKVGAVRKLVADGRLAAADDQLARLEQVVTAGHADVREYILNLRVAPTDQQPFFTALQHYLDSFSQNYGIPVDLEVGAGVDEDALTPSAQLQVFRILQEAVSNARKHAGASCVRVSIELHDSRLCIRIQDDGQGFNPQQAAGQGGDHYGLKFMRERAHELGGILRIESAPGRGTCIELEAPVKAVIIARKESEAHHV